MSVEREPSPLVPSRKERSIDWRSLFERVLRAFIPVRTPKQALDASLLHAQYSLRPLREWSEFRSSFPAGAQIDRIAVDEILKKEKRNQPESGGDPSEQARTAIKGLFEVPAGESSPATDLPLTRLRPAFLIHAKVSPKPELTDPSSAMLGSIVETILRQGFESENKKIEEENNVLLNTVRRLSQEGRFLVVHGGNSIISNALLDVLGSSGLQVHHQQELDRQNFYLIPLARWVAFCETTFPLQS